MTKAKQDNSIFYPHEALDQTSPIVPIVDVAEILDKRAQITSAGIKPLVFLDWKFKWVPASDIIIDYETQRGPDAGHVNNMHTGWNPNKAMPAFATRGTKINQYSLLDGQQHILSFLLSIPAKQRNKTLIPVTYVITDDPMVGVDIFIGNNNDQKGVPPYEVYKNKLRAKDPETVIIEDAVIAAGCTTGPANCKVFRCITHMGNLIEASKYGADELTLVLKAMLSQWPAGTVSTVTLLGLLETRKQLKLKTKKAVFDEIMFICKKYFDYANAVQIDTQKAYKFVYDERYSLDRKEKVVAGLVYLYNKQYPKKKLKIKLPLPFEVPIMPVNFGLHATYNKATYKTYEIFSETCKDGDLRRAWAMSAIKRHKGATADELFEICPEACPHCNNTLEYGIGDNDKYGMDKKGKNLTPRNKQPSVDHKTPSAEGGKNRIDNYQILCAKCNTWKGDSTVSDVDAFTKIVLDLAKEHPGSTKESILRGFSKHLDKSGIS